MEHTIATCGRRLSRPLGANLCLTRQERRLKLELQRICASRAISLLTYQYCCVIVIRNITDRSCEMVFNPWRITRAMFLEEDEVASLLARLAGSVAEAEPGDPG